MPRVSLCRTAEFDPASVSATGAPLTRNFNVDAVRQAHDYQRFYGRNSQFFRGPKLPIWEFLFGRSNIVLVIVLVLEIFAGREDDHENENDLVEPAVQQDSRSTKL